MKYIKVNNSGVVVVAETRCPGVVPIRSELRSRRASGTWMLRQSTQISDSSSPGFYDLIDTWTLVFSES